MDPRGTLAVLLAVVAFLVAAAVFPLHLLGSASEVFPAGNPVGETVGAWLKDQLVTWLGLGCGAVRAWAPCRRCDPSGGWWHPAVRRCLRGFCQWRLLLILPVVAGLARRWRLQDQPGTWEARWAMPVEAWELGGLPPGWWWLAATVVTSIAAFRFNPLPPLAGAGGEGGARGRARCAEGGVRDAEERRPGRDGWWVDRPVPREWEQCGQGSRAGWMGVGGPPSPHALAGACRSRRAGEDPFPPPGAGGGARERILSPDVADAGAAGVPRCGAGASPAPAMTRGYDAAAGEMPSAGGSAALADFPLPPIELLTAPEADSNRYGMERDLDRLAGVLLNTLRTFNIDCEIAGRTTGPAVTQYEVVPAAGVKVNRIANLEADLALAMRARSVRIVAPIPGKGAVGVEIPNPRPEMVRLREIVETEAFARSRGSLPLAMGKDLTGRPYVADLAGMPHALIAGATGSGKSVCLNTIITSLVYRHGPESLRFLLIDPKMVELSAYADLPHLRHPVVTDPREAANVLKWACMEMERRYTLLSANGVRSLQEFNARLAKGGELRLSVPSGPEDDPESWRYVDGPLPWIVVVVDELADLMMTVQAEVEKPLAQLAQKARAIGIHLLVATQRPSVNVVTGLIKANFPCRIAFRVASKTDSRTILDQNGADSLLGHGDMLFLPPGQSEPVRMQGAFISTEETGKLMQWFREEADTIEAIKARVRSREPDILEEVQALDGGLDAEEGAFATEWDELFRDAAAACIAQGSGSTSLLQRKLRIGYGRAARIVDQLHEAGVLGPPDGSRPREVLVDSDGLDEICPA